MRMKSPSSLTSLGLSRQVYGGGAKADRVWRLAVELFDGLLQVAPDDVSDRPMAIEKRLMAGWLITPTALQILFVETAEFLGVATSHTVSMPETKLHT